MFKKPTIMGILNVTPDSFSDGGQFQKLDQALKQVDKMIQEGADIIDVGGESTRPGAEIVSLSQELDRVIPIIESIKANFDTLISIDSSKPEVMKQAVLSGANMINDVNALQAEGAIDVASQLNVPVCLMHMQGNPQIMQDKPSYQDIIAEVTDFFNQRIEQCLVNGIQEKNIILDPGFGFGKTLEHNLSLLERLDDFSSLGFPILVGLSRKSLLDRITGKTVSKRLAGSVALAMIASQNNASIFRVHDVAETVDVLKVANCFNKTKH